MNISHLSPFVEATAKIGQEFFGKAPIRGGLSITNELITRCPINLVSEVSGDIAGIVMVGLSRETALLFAESILNRKLRVFDQTVAVALIELGTKIQEDSSIAIKESGVEFSMSLIGLVRGINLAVPTHDQPCLLVPLEFDGIGRIDVNLSVREKRSQHAA